MLLLFTQNRDNSARYSWCDLSVFADVSREWEAMLKKTTCWEVAVSMSVGLKRRHFFKYEKDLIEIEVICLVSVLLSAQPGGQVY